MKVNRTFLRKDKYIEVDKGRFLEYEDLEEFEKNVIFKSFQIGKKTLYIGYLRDRFKGSSSFYVYSMSDNLGEVYEVPCYLKYEFETGERFFYFWKYSKEGKKIRYFLRLDENNEIYISNNY